ncbi:GNAT family N-acetyltransferase [Curtobacterium flaccumfaciens]|uniref:GNAT family N-acetyltransferase n=1 Tax=Curtobacterium flaccumfaciens TaxID=2035 RepID=UPI001BDDFFE1|nr:GNAT family N-acetyltransferase [Curtobacterium flaccumfaciens]MBT1632208.1 GNAT family N-acetyltransferase [Curtobacterium flaccumfaciens pv. oortii]MCX2845941.1 GNAT family N-acetyltransferase [Curtobacterium flaccumfaciens pv. oortii]
MDVALRDSTTEDLEWLVELRAVVLRDDLTRLGVFDETRVRQRLRDAFRAQLTRIVVVDGRDVGSVTVRVEDDVRWVEHFYLAPDVQGRGVGSTVLRAVLDEPHDGPTRLNVLVGSPARRLYERHGFVLDTDDGVDVFMTLRAADRAPHGVH